MFCPKCKDEFVQGILICPDCKVSLCDQLYQPVQTVHLMLSKPVRKLLSNLSIESI